MNEKEKYLCEGDIDVLIQGSIALVIKPTGVWLYKNEGVVTYLSKKELEECLKIIKENENETEE